jgi:hypothetical protein
MKRSAPKTDCELEVALTEHQTRIELRVIYRFRAVASTRLPRRPPRPGNHASRRSR